MHRTQRTRRVTGSSVVVGALLTVGLAGCSATNPQTIITPYPAADGVNVSIGNTGVGLRNMLVIGTEKGSPASVIGAVVNESDAAASVSLQADLGESAQPSQTVVQVPAHGAVQLGPTQKTQMTIPDLPVVPGALTGLSAATANGGRADLDVPVLTPTTYYASQAPNEATTSPEPSTSAKPTEGTVSGPNGVGTTEPQASDTGGGNG